ncbi:polysaccharide deacetylase family protein [Mycolicibacterium sphagni]|uniref:Polysaccharide deacetylase family protein n=1 Tax=Mycolicibacterium sphagni TaxID=1786 RepID=A0ABX2JZW2_9MYCO|nr:polysaccharide deacetylase family protein [Mycolicibacterium sphagni]NTY60376.1 polysaccharide deacetylase family protein [Mycolicibacterium sphagni]
MSKGDVNRRRLLVLAAAVVAGGTVTAADWLYDGQGRPQARPPSPAPPAAPPVLAAATPAASPPPRLLPPPDPRHRVRLPGGGVLSQLPANDNTMALTVDDGVNSEVVRLYIRFARDTGVRMTFFLNGVNKSWTDNRDELRPLVDSGQIQLGNHTWSHPDLTTVSSSTIRAELVRNDLFMKDTYGVDAAPYFRPPYGKYNSAVEAVAADLGYTVATLWSGSLADSTVISEDYIVKMANRYFTPRTIVLGHLNHLPVTHVYGALVEIIRARNIRTVTLNDVFLPQR